MTNSIKEEVARKQMYKDSINAWKETYPEVVAKRIEWCEKERKHLITLKTICYENALNM